MEKKKQRCLPVYKKLTQLNYKPNTKMKPLLGEDVIKDIELSLGVKGPKKGSKPITGNFYEKVKDNKVN